MSETVVLTDQEIIDINNEAARRQAENEAKKLRGRNRAPASGQKALELHVLGCTGEYAVAKYLDVTKHLFLDKRPVPGSCDLPGGIEVKTRSKHGYDLLIQLDDKPSKLFVLATYEGGSAVEIVGWTHGFNVMKSALIREFVRGRPCYAVPQKLLKPISELSNAFSSQSSSNLAGPYEAWVDNSKENPVVIVDRLTGDRLGWYHDAVLTVKLQNSSQYCLETHDHQSLNLQSE